MMCEEFGVNQLVPMTEIFLAELFNFPLCNLTTLWKFWLKMQVAQSCLYLLISEHSYGYQPTQESHQFDMIDKYMIDVDQLSNSKFY